MKIDLDSYECRIIGCLIEKEITTPDQYPLSLNALTNACNQKSNREPVMELDEITVQQTVDGLIKKYRLSKAVEFHNRVAKYRHQFCNTEFGDLKFTKQELAIICVLLLRGPQTPGELRTRTNRLCDFRDARETESVIDTLMTREDGPFVVQHPREPGKREARYQHLFDDGTGASINEPEYRESRDSLISEPDRLRQLENQVTEMRKDIHELRQMFESINRN